jgi:hypothetical protein
VLANFLPGVRQLRAPLAAGLLWLLAVWLVVEPSIPASGADAGEPWHAFDEIGRAVSGLGIGLAAIAVTFAAYLVGSLTENVWRALPSRAFGSPRVFWDSPQQRRERDAGRLRLRLRRLRIFASFTGIFTVGPTFVETGLPWPPTRFPPQSDPVLPSIEAFEKLRELAGQWLESAGYATERGEIQPMDVVDGLVFEGPGLWATYTLPKAEVVAKVISELDLIRTRLLGKEPELFSAVDRISSESELRFAILPPLVALIGVLAVQSTPLWLAGLLLVWLLLRDGARRRRAASDLLIDAIYLERVKPPAVDMLIRAGAQLR